MSGVGSVRASSMGEDAPSLTSNHYPAVPPKRSADGSEHEGTM